MRILACLIGLAFFSGCSEDTTCKPGTLALGVEFTFGTDVADGLNIDIVLGQNQMMSMHPHTPGEVFTTVEVDFPSGYPADKTIVVDSAATLSGAVIGKGSDTIHLLPGCTSGLSHIYPPFSSPDAGSAD